MSMAVVLTDDGEDFVLSAASAGDLARLDVTNVTLVRGHGDVDVDALWRGVAHLLCHLGVDLVVLLASPARYVVDTADHWPLPR